MSNFYLMDDRAMQDPDSAIVLTVCNSEKEARKEAKDYGACVIMKEGKQGLEFVAHIPS